MHNAYVIPEMRMVRPRTNSSVAVIAPFYLLLAGTAGIYHPQAVAELADFSPTPIIRVTGRESRKQRSVAQKIARARTILGLNMTEVAELFGVSRTAVYDWIKGAHPKSEVVSQIHLLSDYADSLDEGSNRLGRLSQAGRGILTEIRSGKPLEQVLSVRSTLDAKQPAVRTRKLGFGRVHEGSAYSELVTPIILERT